MSNGIHLSKSQCPTTTDERDHMSKVSYVSAVGSIMYAMISTRPDVSYSLSVTSRYQSDPVESHWTAVKNILKYLRRTKNACRYPRTGVPPLAVPRQGSCSYL